MYWLLYFWVRDLVYLVLEAWWALRSVQMGIENYGSTKIFSFRLSSLQQDAALTAVLVAGRS
jgi:hypothetical protein